MIIHKAVFENGKYPRKDGLMVNREECQEQIEAFLALLPVIFGKTAETASCAGSAISIGQKLMAKNGGRVTVFSTARVNTGIPLMLNHFYDIIFRSRKIRRKATRKG